MEHAKYIVRFLLLLVSRPQDLWEYLQSDGVEEAKPESMQQRYFLPLLGFMSLFVFLCQGFHNNSGMFFDLQYGMKQMIPSLVAFLIGPYVAVLVLKLALTYLYKVEHPSKDRLHLFVFYSTSFLMALEMLEAFIPKIRFFSFIVVYLLYITWTGSSTFIRVQDRHRWVFGFLSAAVIFCSSHLFHLIIIKMQG